MWTPTRSTRATADNSQTRLDRSHNLRFRLNLHLFQPILLTMSSWRQRRWLLEHHQDLHND